MTTSTKIKSFTKQVISVLKGDDAEATAQKVLRKVDSALQVQIASLTGDLISLEDNLETAKENLSLARINGGVLFTDGSGYISRLFSAKNKVTDAEEALTLHKERIAFLKAESAALDEEVDA